MAEKQPGLLRELIAINKQPTNRFHFNGRFGQVLAVAGMIVFGILLLVDVASSTSAIWGFFFDPFQRDTHGQHTPTYTGIAVSVSIVIALGITIGYFYTFFSHGSGYYQEKQAQDINEAIHQHDAMTSNGLVRGIIYWALHLFDDGATLLTFFFMISTNIRGLWQFQNPSMSMRGDLVTLFIFDTLGAILWDYLATQGFIRAFHVWEDSVAKVRRSKRWLISLPDYNIQPVVETDEDPVIMPAPEPRSLPRRGKQPEVASGTFRQEKNVIDMEDLPLRRGGDEDEEVITKRGARS